MQSIRLRLGYRKGGQPGEHGGEIPRCHRTQDCRSLAGYVMHFHLEDQPRKRDYAPPPKDAHLDP